MGVVTGGGGGGGGSSRPALPVADPTGVVVDTTTYSDTIKGSGKLTTLVFPADATALAIALQGDAFPRWVLGADPSDFGFLFGDGTADPAVAFTSFIGSSAGGVAIPSAQGPALATQLGQVSAKGSITGALPTVSLTSGTAAQIQTTRDVEAVTPVTFNPTAGAAATCAVALSPDNSTYSTTGTETVPAGVALDGTIRLVTVRVPAGWYLRLTVTNAVLGTTTYS